MNNSTEVVPIGSMYGRFYILLICMVNLGKYTI